MKMYEGMLRKDAKQGKLNYYPVSSKEEWEELPALYKAMEWEPVKDPHHNGELKAVKSVIFDVPYMEPYGSRAEVSVHPQEVQKILFCNFEKSDCHLYTICGVELEGGTRLGAKWLQDSVSGSFAVVLNNGNYVARQGGFDAYIPEHVQKSEDGTFKYDFKYNTGKTTHYTVSNPFNSITSPDIGDKTLKNPSHLNENNIELNARLGISLDVSLDELNILKKGDKQAQELLLGLLHTDRLTVCGDTYFPEPWNEEYLSDDLNFDLPLTQLSPRKDCPENTNSSLNDKIQSASVRASESKASAETRSTGIEPKL